MKIMRKYPKSGLIFVIVVIIILTIIIISSPPNTFPDKPFQVKIASGESISEVAEDLYSQKAIRSRFFFKIAVAITSRNKGVLAGDYRFTYPHNIFSIARRMAEGQQGQTKVRIVIPEGSNVYDMAYIYLNWLTDFNAPRFVSLAIKYEGYLYPDTYYFLENAKPEEIIRTMRENFNKKIVTIAKDIEKFDKLLEEVVTMASLVEKETYADESRKVVAGILWKRIDEGMPLQVDAPFYYLTGKRGNFTLDDLKIESPFNTYLNKGLPPAPISNPSLATILDVIQPKVTSYYFYLTDRKGVMRYADTFAQHVDNKNMYLR